MTELYHFQSHKCLLVHVLNGLTVTYMHLTFMSQKLVQSLSRFMLSRKKLSSQPFGSSIVWKIVMKRGKWGERKSWPEFCWFGDSEKGKWFWQFWVMFCCGPVSCAVAKLTLLSNTFHIAQTSHEPSNVANGNPNSSLIWGKGRFDHVIFSSLAVKIPITKHLQLTEQELLPPPPHSHPCPLPLLGFHFLQHRHAGCET